MCVCVWVCVCVRVCCKGEEKVFTIWVKTPIVKLVKYADYCLKTLHCAHTFQLYCMYTVLRAGKYCTVLYVHSVEGLNIAAFRCKKVLVFTDGKKIKNIQL